MGAVVCLLLALQWGGTTYAWRDSKIIGLFIGFGLILIPFVYIQVKRGEDATISLKILKQRTVLTGTIFTALLGMGLYTHFFYLPFYFQAVKGTSAEESGIRTIPYLVSLAISSIVIGGTITVVGFYVPFMIFGAVAFTVGAATLYLLHVGTSAKGWIGYQVLTGFGAGAANQIPFIAVQAALSSVDMPLGNAILMFSTTLSGAITISIAQNVFANTLVKEVPKYTTGISGADILALGATHLRESVPPDQLAGVLKAYDVALNTTFILPIVSGSLCVVTAFFMEWKNLKGKSIIAEGGA